MTSTLSSRPAAPPHLSEPPLARRGGPRFWRISAGMFAGGFGAFSLLYCVQPLMPVFARDFSVSPAASSLTLSAATGVLSVAMFAAGVASERFGRKPVMAVSLAVAAAMTLLAAAAPNFPALVALRALTGLALAGLPAVAMAYLAEEMNREAIGLSMGLYIAGSTIGGLSGRLSGAAIADHWGWRAGLACVGAVALIDAALLVLALPRQRRFAPRPPSFAAFRAAVRMHLADPGLRYLFAEGFLVMGAFVCTYNYIGFRLLAPPFSLSQTAIGFIFVNYLLGAVASTVVGDLAGRYGRRNVIVIAIILMPLGVAATLFSSLALTVFGVALVTAGFFGGHSIASSWVGLRAEKERAMASALYLFFYYLGSSLVGWIGGWVYQRGGWPGTAALIGAFAAAAVVIAMKLSRVPPPAWMAAREAH